MKQVILRICMYFLILVYFPYLSLYIAYTLDFPNFDLLFSLFDPVDRSRQAVIPIWVPNMALKGSHVIYSKLVQSDVTCSLLCLRNPKCFSFNFSPKGKRCELTDSPANIAPRDIVTKYGTNYYELRFF